MGHYRSEEGFRTFSKAKGVIRKGIIDTASMVAPPWNNRMFKGFIWFMKFRFRPVKVD
ncbi:hypothetical protein [Thalassolituus maritimus]|uniref:Uncharacterized protein n=1 Tax=Thalassolituus maritimus TaxID=484498 RepID=A0ABP9ZXG7_9GAMM